MLDFLPIDLSDKDWMTELFETCLLYTSRCV